ncbi:MAG TPA: tripartite tricarboxylate transporter substrate binding protein [Ramlibacter sp.]|nr:tripartite tricarboxylate transporter substrate binding protein [Ramlibacter sp.]
MKRFVSALVLMSLAWAAQAQAYPTRPIRLVVPFAAGSSIDLLGRAVAQGLSDKLGQPVVVDSKPGAGSAVGASAVGNSQADGYTLLLGTNATFAVNPILYKKLPYDPNGFQYIGATGGMPSFLIVGANTPYKTFAEFIKAAKERPGAIKFASSGVGSTGHLVGKVLENTAGIEMLHVPYKDGPQGLTATITGEVDAIFYPSGAAMSMINSGKVRPLAVSTGKRTADLPNVPTVAESGYPKFDLTGWTVLAAPEKTPAAVVDKLKEAVASLYSNPAYLAKVDSLGLVTQKMTGKDLDAFVHAEQRSMADLAKRANIQPE